MSADCHRTEIAAQRTRTRKKRFLVVWVRGIRQLGVVMRNEAEEIVLVEAEMSVGLRIRGHGGLHRREGTLWSYMVFCQPRWDGMWANLRWRAPRGSVWGFVGEGSEVLL
uniref:Uncharacterized protein n=1 Tax=Bionectria ochroleuca TaxID=29856 RepID=A0A8H7NNL4_BIOOC